MLAGLALGASAALITGVGQVLMAATSRRIGTIVTTALVLSASLAWFLPLVPLATFPESGEWWLQMAVIGCINAAAFILAVEALRLGPLTIVGPIAATGSVVTVVMAALLLHEPLPDIAIVAVPVVGLGAVLCSIAARPTAGPALRLGSFVSAGAVAMTLAVLLIGLFTVALQQPVRDAGWGPSVLAARVVSVAASVVLLAPRLRSERLFFATPSSSEASVSPTFAHRLVAPAAIILVGLILSVAQILLAVSLEVAPAWLVGATTALGPAVIALAGVVVYGERLAPPQLTGMVAIALGISMLTIGLAFSG